MYFLLTAHLACTHIFRWNPLVITKAQYFAPERGVERGSFERIQHTAGISGVEFSVSQVFGFWEVLFKEVKGMGVFLLFNLLFKKNLVYWPACTLVKTAGQINSYVSQFKVGRVWQVCYQFLKSHFFDRGVCRNWE